jgi:hypothetical protein
VSEHHPHALGGVDLAGGSPEPETISVAPEPEVRLAHLIIVLVVLVGLVGLLLWIVPQTVGAGVVNVTVRT